MLINGITIMITITVENNDKKNNKVDKKITTTHVTKKQTKCGCIYKKSKSVDTRSFDQGG